MNNANNNIEIQKCKEIFKGFQNIEQVLGEFPSFHDSVLNSINFENNNLKLSFRNISSSKDNFHDCIEFTLNSAIIKQLNYQVIYLQILTNYGI